MVRPFGALAALAATTLVLMIGLLAFGAQRGQQNITQPPGSQASAPAAGHGVSIMPSLRFALPGFFGVYANAPASPSGGAVYIAPSAPSAGAPPAFSGSAGAGTGTAAGAGTSAGVNVSNPAVPSPCTGLVQSLLGLVSSVLGGGGC